MLTMASQILKSADFSKTSKSRYLQNETFFLQIEKFINYTSKGYFMTKNNFVVEVTFNFILFVHTGHTDFTFNQCSISTECYF